MYAGYVQWPDVARRPSATRLREATMKKKLGLMGLLATIAAAIMFWRRKNDDDEFLDEELE